ncbi:MAG: hypothetical protein EBZ49_11960 [Proteobacteria bacterium]|nr:hypothetical protein [Pseudomonadota bacterium]
MEFFGKASYSKTNLGAQQYLQSLSGSTGIAIMLIPQVRIEGRYTLQNQYQNMLTLSALDVLTNIKVQTAVYSAGLDIALAGERSTFVPFFYFGAGYAETLRTWDYTDLNTNTTTPGEDQRTGLAGQVAFGVRWRVSKGVAFELEANAYSINFYKPGALVDVSGNAGLRFFM